jgi:hypothetical protein
MNDFFKTKVGFTIGLLAAVFAFKPLVDSNSDVGFSIFQVKITIEYAYIFLTAFLGMAVYFISLQFASSKHVKTLDAISDACYTIALATPPVYIAFWLITISLRFIGIYVSQISESTFNYLAGFLSAVLGWLIYSFLNRSIKSKFLAADKQQERKIDIEVLTTAKRLADAGMYDMSVLESSKIVESALTRLLTDKGVPTWKVPMIELVKLTEKYSILNKNERVVLSEINKKRNEAAHTVYIIDKVTAYRVLEISKGLILRIDALSTSSGYKWLEKNRDEVIKLLKGGDIHKCRQTLNMLKEAWRNRDGAVWLHLSDFFEVALVFNPELIIIMFEDDNELLESWLEKAEDQLFTDFVGGQTERLIDVRNNMISQLKDYTSHTKIQQRLDIATMILTKIEESKITAIS